MLEPQESANPNPPNISKARTRRKNLPREKLESDYPSFMQQTKNPLSKAANLLNDRGEVLFKLGLVEAQVTGVPKITDKIVAGWGSIEEAVSVLEGDDDPDSIRFMSKWNLLTDREKQRAHLEDVMTAAGLTGRRFIELLAGATQDHDEFVAKMFKSRKKIKVLESTFKAATDEVPILDRDGEPIGTSNGDVKAMELFFKLTGDIKPANMMINSGNQTANITAPPEREPLPSMDKWLLEIDDVRKPKQLAAPVIPVEVPEGAPEIEYLDLGE